MDFGMAGGLQGSARHPGTGSFYCIDAARVDEHSTGFPDCDIPDCRLEPVDAGTGGLSTDRHRRRLQDRVHSAHLGRQRSIDTVFPRRGRNAAFGGTDQRGFGAIQPGGGAERPADESQCAGHAQPKLKFLGQTPNINI